VDPHGFHVQYRIRALRDEAAGRRLARSPRASPGPEDRRTGRLGRPVRAVAISIGMVLVRIGTALGAPIENA
jgi:hypothetical protein